ncbi:MAG: ABC transporter permease [Spirochaetaceae bacterium]|nr:MAG: ABC transporter permease [Spirochaetaceae bacterium]
MSDDTTATFGGADGVAIKKKAGEKLFVASQWQLFVWKFFRHKVAVVSVVLLLVLYIVCVFAEFFGPYDPRDTDRAFLFAPPTRIRMFHEGRIRRPFIYPLVPGVDEISMRRIYTPDTTRTVPVRLFHRGDPYKLWGVFESDLRLFGVEEGKLFLMGADPRGRDVFTRTLHGGRLSLSVGLVGIAMSFVIGIVMGGLSGYIGGVLDLIVQRIIEFVRSIPTLPLWMGLSVALPPHWSVVRVYFGIVLILSLMTWTGLARVVRGKFLSLREEDFVLAARLCGARQGRIIFRQMLPSFYSYIIASLTLSIPAMILGETSLSFIGLGLQAPAISWGVLLRDAQQLQVLAHTPWLVTPALFVIGSILAFNFAGDGLRDAADPYARI